jgi:hypothetical protein
MDFLLKYEARLSRDSSADVAMLEQARTPDAGAAARARMS